MDRDPLNECIRRDETNDQDDLSAEDTKTFLRLHSAYTVMSIIFPRCEFK